MVKCLKLNMFTNFNTHLNFVELIRKLNYEAVAMSSLLRHKWFEVLLYEG